MSGYIKLVTLERFAFEPSLRGLWGLTSPGEALRLARMNIWQARRVWIDPTDETGPHGEGLRTTIRFLVVRKRKPYVRIAPAIVDHTRRQAWVREDIYAGRLLENRAEVPHAEGLR